MAFRNVVFIWIAVLFLSGPKIRAGSLLQTNDTVAVAGDSTIAQPYVEQYLLMCQPTTVRTMEIADGDQRAVDFLGELPAMVTPFHPTVVSLSTAVGDGCFISLPPLSDQMSDFRRSEASIIEALKKGGVRQVVLTSSPCIDPAHFNRPSVAPDKYAQTLKMLADFDKELAGKESVPYADLYDDMLGVLQKAKAKYGNDLPFEGDDGYHPFASGQLVEAWVLLRALGCDGNIGTITVDYAGKRAAGSPGHDIVSYQDGVVTVKSSRYPFCFTGTVDDVKNGGANAAITTIFPFNDDLNRYMLVVKNLPGVKATVTWGTQSKDFTSADLAKGINLAAEFYNNPFQPAWAKVANAVYIQQNQENFFVNAFLAPIPYWLRDPLGPGAAAGLQEATASGVAYHESLWKQATDSVVPVVHTIKINALP